MPSVQKGYHENGFKKVTRIGSKRLPADQFKKVTSIKEKKKEILKQQHAAVTCESYVALVKIGFDPADAKKLARQHPPETVLNQIKWLKLRKADKNALGLLRNAIQGNWEKPAVTNTKTLDRCSKAIALPSAPSTSIPGVSSREARAIERKQLLAEWACLSQEQWSECHRMAVQQAPTSSDRLRLQRHTDLSQPPTPTLLAMQKLHVASTSA